MASDEAKSKRLQSFFGWGWDLAEPLTMAVVFIALRNSGIVAVGAIELPYTVFVLFGLLLYQSFADALLTSVGLVRQSSGLLKNPNVEAECLIVTCCARIAIQSVFRIVVMLAVAIGMGAWSAAGILKFVALFPLILLPGVALGLVLAPLNAIYEDVGRATRIAVNLFRFASPVFYVMPTSGPLAYLQLVNPVGAILSLLRSLATTNTTAEFLVVLIWVSPLVLLAGIGTLFFRLSLPILQERT